MINEIKDYTNRLNYQDSKLDSLKRAVENSGEKKKFQDALSEEINSSILGKVTSSEIKRPFDIKSEIEGDPYRKKLYNASVEFESMFVKLMLNQMKKSVDKSGWINGGYAEEIFEDMLYDEYSKEISKNSNLGIAEEIYKYTSQSLPEKNTR